MTPLRAMAISLLLLASSTCAVSQDSAPASQPDVVNNEQVQNRGANKDNWWDALPRPEYASFEKIEQDQDWFEVYKVASGVFAIYEPGQFEEVISFLVLGDDRALLFDTGLGIGDMRRVVQQLTELDIIVLNSHTHYDHIGGNHQFETIWARDTAFTRSRAAGGSADAVAEFLTEGWVWKSLPPEFDANDYRSRPFKISKFVDEGDIVDLGGRSLEIIATPGHAPDAICLLDRENRLLLTGDTFYLATLYTHLDGSDFDAYARTAQRLASLAGSIDFALTSHNVPVVAASYMTALGAAFAAIQAGTAEDYSISDGFHEYFFDGFSIMTRDADQPAGR